MSADKDLAPNPKEPSAVATKDPNTVATKQPSADEEVRRLAAEVDAARDDLGQVVAELDRRRHAVTRKLPLALISVALVAVAGAGIAFAVSRHRRRQTVPSKLGRLRAALARLAEEPDRLAPREGSPAAKKVATGAATATGSGLAKVLVAKLLTRA